MEVILVNGSPNAQGSTWTALNEVASTLNKEGIQTRIFQVGTQPLSGCIACLKCRDTGRCVFPDKVNEFLDLAENADGFIFGAPVHFSAISGSMSCFMHRAFFATIVHGSDTFYLKPAAAVVATRRAGATSALDQINKYFTIAEMMTIGSKYWNMVFGMVAKDVPQDLEGMQTMRVLARNMAWFLRCKEAAAKAGVALPEREKRISTNFIR